MLATPSYAMISAYFDKRRAKAMSIATLSYGLGGMFSPIIQFLLVEYGYSGTMILLGGLMLHFCITGALFRPIIKHDIQKREEIPMASLNVNPKPIANHVDKSAEHDENQCDEKPPKSQQNVLCRLFWRVCQWFLITFDLRLVSDVPFMLFSALMTGAIICAQVNVIFISSLAKEKQFTNIQVSILT